MSDLTPLPKSPTGNLSYLSPGMSVINSAEKNEIRTDKHSEPISLDEEPTRQITAENVKGYLKAEISLHLKGPVSNEVYERRTAICMGCSERRNPESKKDRIGYCNACGCGTGKRAALSVKLKMPESSCPLSLWSSTEGVKDGIRSKLKAYLLDWLLK